ncbi:zinc finger protein 628 [Megalops cyprinoides]|uniref:zinc finger protein 628 n=1 Tax=Megalops cyprinoides TaxID=118141 RepID=UPI0018654E96|nr:zinc finger protein 628 [Megalops cyprinoides]
MAAVHSPEPQRHHVEPLSSLEDDPGGMTEKRDDGCTSTPPGYIVANDDSGNDKESNCETKVSGDGAAGLCASPTESGIVHQPNNAAMVPSLVIDLTAPEAEALMHPGVSCDSQREFEWSEGEEVSELRRDAKRSVRNNVTEVQVDLSPKVIDNGVESSPGAEEMEVLKSSPSQDMEKMARDTREELGEKGVGEKAEVPVKQRKSRLMCQECGKLFTRRETFNLHRHFHTHQDELASLTCKECGLTFQHRSSLIKHRSEHKEKTAPVGVDRRAHSREGRSLQCEHCGETFLTLGKLRCHPCQHAPEKPYRCPLCRREFQYRVSVNAHMQTHSLDSPYRCLECNKGFQCGLTLRIHQRSHAALKPFECPECGLVFRHRSVMEDHRRRHSEDRPHQCGICSKRFKYGSLLHQHQFLHTGQKPFRCPDCGKKFAFAQNMRAHWRQHRKLSHACPRCPLTFLDLNTLQAHMLGHQAVEGFGGAGRENVNNAEDHERSHNCPLCPLTLADLASLKAHILIHEAEEGFGGMVMESAHENENHDHSLACPRCSLTLPDLTSLQAHILTHEAPVEQEVGGVEKANDNSMEELPGGGWGDQVNRKPLKCNECGKTFRHRSVLELHMRIHSRDKPFQCKVCGKGFKFSSYLQQHLIIHTGQKPFKCPDCGKDFAFLQNMKTHQRLHQQKPYRCTQCRKGYSEESELQRHMVSHTGDKPHKCQLCDKSFGLAYLLRDHLNTHTGERPHRCQECNKSFPWLSSLLVHQKIHARKRQGLSQPLSLPIAPQRARGRGRGSRGRRGSRWVSGWPRWAGGEGVPALPPPPPYPVPIARRPEWHERLGQQQPPLYAPQFNFHEQWQQQQQQWRSDGPVLQQQQQPVGWADTAASTQVGPAAVQYGSPHPPRTDGATVWGFQTPPAAPHTLSSPKKPGEGQEQQQQQQQQLGWSDAAASAQMGSPLAQQESPRPASGNGSAVWGFQAPVSMPQTLSSPKKTGDVQDHPQSLGWNNALASAKIGPTTVQYEESHSRRGNGGAVFSFQSPPAGPQTLHSSPSKPAEGQEQQQHQPQKQQKPPQPMMMDPQVHPDRTSSVLSLPPAPPPPPPRTSSLPIPPPPPLGLPPISLPHPPLAIPPPTSLALPQNQPHHPDVAGSIPPPAQNNYLTQQRIMSERLPCTQALPLLQPAQLAKTHQLDSGRPLPFARNPLLQCMICGCSLPRELDLHLHYMRHAQGEI